MTLGNEIIAKKFSYDTDAVSKKQFDAHMKLYNGYVGKINEITDILKSDPAITKKANSVYSKYRELKKEESFALDGVILHELYFKNMSAGKNDKKRMPCEKTLNAIKSCYDSFEKWSEDFIACALSSRGWCIFSYEQRTKMFRNILADTHDNGIVCMAFPLLVLDVYEHAYFLDYETDRLKYIEKFMNSIDWDVVERRIEMIS